MKRSEQTNKSISKLRIAQTIDFIILVIPTVVYVVMGIIAEGKAVYEKVTLISAVFIALVLLLFNIVMKKHLRSPIWIILIGIYVALENIMPLIIMIAASSIIDELFLDPFIKRTKVEVISNKTLDKRL